MKIDILLLVICAVMVFGCAIHRHSDIIVTNAEYRGTRGDVHYVAETDLNLFSRKAKECQLNASN